MPDAPEGRRTPEDPQGDPPGDRSGDIIGGRPGVAFHVTHPHERVALLEVSSPAHREFFQVAEGDRTLAVTVLDVTNPPYREPRVYVIEKPPGWRSDAPA